MSPHLASWFKALVVASVVLLPGWIMAAEMANDAAGNVLGLEVAKKGWIVYSAKTPQGDYDLFLARPDGSQARNITQTPKFNEFGGRFSPNGKQMLYRRTVVNVPFNHDLWGATGILIVAQADGSAPEVMGAEGGFPWACWNQDMTQMVCLYKREGKVRIFQWPAKRLIKEFPRQGIFQQLYWSADGQRVCGTANVQGQDWKIVSLEVATGKATMVSRDLSCTADWFQKDTGRIIYSSRTPGLATDYGWTMLMQGTADGQNRTLVYGERDKHVYYGCTSPDDRYVIFSIPESDGGLDSQMSIVRLADTPIIVPADYEELRELYPNARSGPVLRLPMAGFEPHWTYADIGTK